MAACANCKAGLVRLTGRRQRGKSGNGNLLGKDDRGEPRRMVTFEHATAKFTLRAAAVVIRDRHVLLNRTDDVEFWYLPGGRVELGESAAEALCREILEELSVAVTAGRMLWVIENFFHFDGSAHHELGLYFELELPDTFAPASQPQFETTEDGRRLIFRWFPVDQLSEVPLVPSVLKEGLKQLPPHTVHVVHADGLVT